MIVLSNFNLSQNELQNAILQPLATPPLDPKPYQIYTDSTSGKIKQFIGGQWVTIGAVVENSENNGKIIVDGREIEVYSLPKATSEVLGGVKPGTGLEVTSDGTLNKDVQYFSIIRLDGQSDDEAISAAVGETTPSDGDVCIIKTLISGDKYSFTAFVYDGTWKAMDGNVDATNVYLSKDITITAPIGVHTIPSSGSKTLDSSGKSVQNFLEYLTAEEKNPTITQPYIVVSDFGAKGYEVGTRVTPRYTAVLNPGKYSYGPDTEVTPVSWKVSDTDGTLKETVSGEFNEILVEDNTSYKLTLQCVHTDGVVPVTNLGNPYESGKILGGEGNAKTKVSGSISGFRSYFYGVKAEKDSEINSVLIRSLTNSGKAVAPGSFRMNISDGTMRVIVAFPTAAGKTLSKVEDKNAFGTDIVGSFVKQVVQVEGVNGYTAVDYDVWVYDSGKALSSNEYTITIA